MGATETLVTGAVATNDPGEPTGAGVVSALVEIETPESGPGAGLVSPASCTSTTSPGETGKVIWLTVRVWPPES